MNAGEARDLIRDAVEPATLLDGVGDEDDLRLAGVSSGELILIAVRCEQQMGRALSEDELRTLVSIRAVAEILGGIDGPV